MQKYIYEHIFTYREMKCTIFINNEQPFLKFIAGLKLISHQPTRELSHNYNEQMAWVVIYITEKFMINLRLKISR